MNVAYASNEQFFEAVRAFADRLDAGGHATAASEVRNGFACLNGLTDGWAMFRENLQGVLDRHGNDFTAEQQDELSEFVAVVEGVVHRR